MKKLFLSFMLLLLFSVLNIKATNIVVKTDKQSSTNSSIAKKVADKEKIDKKKKVFDKNLNVALLTDEELKQLINDALLNCNNAELMELGTKLGRALKFDLTPIISSAILARTKCDLKKSQRRCIHAYRCFFKEALKGEYSDETRKIMDEAINGVPIGCQDWPTVGHMVSITPLAMDISIKSDKDFDKAWSIYKRGMHAIKACKKGPKELKEYSINYLNGMEGITQSIHEISRDEFRKNIKLSLDNAQEMKTLVETLPSDKFRGGEREKQSILKGFQKHIEEKNSSR